MVTEKQVLSLGKAHGFTSSPRRGFVGLERQRADGVNQRLDVFWWSNPKIADAHGTPRSYLVLCPTLDGGAEAGRWKVPLVEWPSDGQPTRRWADVADEVSRVIMPIMDGPVEMSVARLEGLDERYLLL